MTDKIYPFTYDELSIEATAHEIAQIARSIRVRPPIMDIRKFAACKFCSQLVNISGSDMEDVSSADEAAEYATMRCNCPEARYYKEEKRRREQAEQDRQFNLMEAENAIHTLFGYASDIGRPVSKDILEILFDTAARVYDHEIVDATISVSNNIKAVIRCSSKGKLLINRRQSDTDQIEIG